MLKTISAIVLASAVGFAAAAASADDKPVEVRIGWNSFAGTAPISAVMQRDRLFEKHAKAMGHDVAAEWIRFVAGPPANEAMVAGRLDLDFDVASAAYVARIKQGVPAVIIGTQASHLSNAIMVRPGSDIDEVADLQGKTVGLYAATSAHYTLAAIVKEHLGKSLREADIKVVNMPPAESIKLPDGIDAAVIWVPFQFIGPKMGLSELLIDANGVTGPAHKTPGIRVPEVAKAWGNPEGYFTDRLYITARRGFAEEHPDLVVAFLQARWEAQDIVAADLDAGVALANEWWKQDPDVARLAAATYPENTNLRNAPLLLEFDALSLIKTSEFFYDLGTIAEPLSWEELQPVILGGADFQKRVWESRGSKPGLDQLRAGFNGSAPGWSSMAINGGEPVWRFGEVEGWGKRHYVPEPFATK
ncbi:MAG: NrtA/SsuA/CpmA family ABC transporter substrate-binding protein [Sneathiellaceae bacterium]